MFSQNNLLYSFFFFPLPLQLANFCRHAFATLSFISETFLFLYVGMDALDIEKWKFVSDRYKIYIILDMFMNIHHSKNRIEYVPGNVSENLQMLDTLASLSFLKIILLYHGKILL